MASKNIIADLLALGFKGNIDDVILEALISGVTKSIVTSIPVFSVPILNHLLKIAVSKILTTAHAYGKEIGVYFIIETKTDQAQAEYEEAVSGLKEAIKTEDESEIQKAHDEFKKKLADLIRIKPISR